MKIPQYEGSVQIKTGNIPQMKPSRDRGAEEVVQAAKTFEETFRGVRDFRQTAEATAFGNDSVNSVLTRWENDPTSLEPEKYYAELDKIAPEAEKNISSQIAKDKFNFEFKRQIDAAKYKIQSSYRKREIDSLEGTLAYMQQQVIDNPPQDMADPLHNQTLMNIREQYNKAVALGVYAKDDANLKFSEFLKKANNSYAEKLLTISPDFLKSELSKPDGGIFNNIPRKDRDTLLDTASDLIERKSIEIKLLQEQALNQKEQEVVDLYSDNKLSLEDLSGLKDKQEISPDFADAMRLAITSPKAVKAETNLQVFEEMLNHTLDRNLKPSELRRKILLANVGGELSMSDARRLLYMSKGDEGTTVFEDYMQEKKPVSFWQHPWLAITKYFENKKIQKEVMNNVIDRAKNENVKPSQLPQVTKEEIDKKVIQDNPQKTQYTVGQILSNDTNGKSYKVIGFFPDGEPDVEEMKK